MSSNSHLIQSFLLKTVRMVVSTRCGGLPGNVRNVDASFGLKTKQLNHRDQHLLEEVSLEVLKQPIELLVTLSLPPTTSPNPHSSETKNSSNSNGSKIILEHWRVQFAQRKTKRVQMAEKMIAERLTVGVRSLHALLSVLPAFSFLRGPSLRYDGDTSTNPCLASRLSTPRDQGGSSTTEGMRFERRTGVPQQQQQQQQQQQHSSSKQHGILQVDVIRSNPFSNGGSSTSAFSSECLEIKLSHGVLRVEVDYRRNIETTHIETPHIIHDYVRSSNNTNTNTNTGIIQLQQPPQQQQRRGRANSKPVAIPGRSLGRDTTTGGIRARSLTGGNGFGLRHHANSVGSPPGLTTGLNLLRQESGHRNNRSDHLSYQQQHQQHHHQQQHHQHQQQIHPHSLPINIQKTGTSLLSIMANGTGLPGTPPLHPTRSPSLSPALHPQSSPLTITQSNSSSSSSRPNSNTGSNASNTSNHSSPHSQFGVSPHSFPYNGSLNSGSIVVNQGPAPFGRATLSPNASPNEYPSSYPTPPFLAGSAPRESSGGPLMSPMWAGLPSPASMGASPPMLGLGGMLPHLSNTALGGVGGDGRTLSLQTYQANYQQNQQVTTPQYQHQQYGSAGSQTGGMGGMGGISRSISSNSLMNYMNNGGVNGTKSQSNHAATFYGSSPTTAAAGWIEYTTKAGTAAPDSFSPWGKVLGVVAARTSAASKSATVSKKIGASYAKVDTSWLKDMNLVLEEKVKDIQEGNKPIGALAVDAPSGTDDLSRVGAFLEALDEHQSQWNEISNTPNTNTDENTYTMKEYLDMSKRQIDASMSY